MPAMTWLPLPLLRASPSEALGRQASAAPPPARSVRRGQDGQREVSSFGVHGGHRHGPIGMPLANRESSVGPSRLELSQTREVSVRATASA
jgi:hypothetical protein